jgi:hypothetical protein
MGLTLIFALVTMASVDSGVRADQEDVSSISSKQSRDEVTDMLNEYQNVSTQSHLGVEKVEDYVVALMERKKIIAKWQNLREIHEVLEWLQRIFEETREEDERWVRELPDYARSVPLFHKNPAFIRRLAVHFQYRDLQICDLIRDGFTVEGMLPETGGVWLPKLSKPSKVLERFHRKGFFPKTIDDFPIVLDRPMNPCFTDDKIYQGVTRKTDEEEKAGIMIRIPRELVTTPPAPIHGVRQFDPTKEDGIKIRPITNDRGAKNAVTQMACAMILRGIPYMIVMIRILVSCMISYPLEAGVYTKKALHSHIQSIVTAEAKTRVKKTPSPDSFFSSEVLGLNLFGWPNRFTPILVDRGRAAAEASARAAGAKVSRPPRPKVWKDFPGLSGDFECEPCSKFRLDFRPILLPLIVGQFILFTRDLANAFKQFRVRDPSRNLSSLYCRTTGSFKFYRNVGMSILKK